MARIENITATPHASGNRIDLAWTNPDPATYLGVRVVRREGTHPVTPDDGFLVAEGDGISSAIDTDLKSETVYYYALFPYTNSPAIYQTDRHNRTSAMATGKYDMPGQMHELLPVIYHRYDTPPSPTEDAALSAADKGKGELLRFLEVVGGELDLLRSYARAALDLYDLDKVDGNLLRLLAEWIGWKIDYRVEIASQRNEIRNAPEIYRTIGIIPTVEATVKRISGWESSTKEFVHNIFASNRPERLNIWAREREAGGAWSAPTDPLSLDFAYEGRPTTVRHADGTLWLFYHTRRKGYWNIWAKTYREDRDEQWSPSIPVTRGKRVDKYPTAVLHNNLLWLFWSRYHEATDQWTIHYRTRPVNGQWSETFNFPNNGRMPSAIVDDAGDMWLFWTERSANSWRCLYSKFTGGAWGAPATLPPVGTNDPRVEDDLFVLFHPLEAPTRRIWLFWTRKEACATPDLAGQNRSVIMMRTKADLNLDANGWSAIDTFSTVPPEYHDREPAAFINEDDEIELYWSSDRAGGWGIWSNVITAGGADVRMSPDIYSQRTPLPLLIDGGAMILYRSNRSITYTSDIYTATETTDFRYGGSTTVRATDTAKIALRGEFNDFQRYTYDNGAAPARNRLDWYGRDTIGLYLVTDTLDPDKVEEGMVRIEHVLREFMPITDRAVPIVETGLETEYVYTYSAPSHPNPAYITESFHDALTSVGDESLPEGEDFTDVLE